jgi:cation diffusion facilitator CzcD-associated flavoprotein CzcO
VSTARASASVDVVVIGAGQAGLSAAYHLRRSAPELSTLVVDGEDGPGGAWRHRWDSLTMATVNHIADLPHMPQDPIDPSTPANRAVPAYFADFEHRNGLEVRRPVHVRSVRPEDPEAGTGSALLVDLAGPSDPSAPLAPPTPETVRTRAVVSATGTWTRPFVPYVPGANTFTGRQLRTVDYTRAEDLAGMRVGIVGGGISATGFLGELSPIATTRWYTRHEPVFREGDFRPEIEGREAIARVEQRVSKGLPPRSVVSVTGLILTPTLRAVRERGDLVPHPMFSRVVPDGVIEADGSRTGLDVLLWATGFRAALDHLAPLHLHGPGGGITMDDTQVAGDPRIHLVGYGTSASTIGANRAGRRAVRRLRYVLAPGPPPRGTSAPAPGISQ